jgi:hypothetical protein
MLLVVLQQKPVAEPRDNGGGEYMIWYIAGTLKSSNITC